ncbi:putative multi-domain regulatory protein [Actinacidiphila reveromycinica]|uniref:Putative multi-domain regulatory protein n=1 Tax=Actinacidiphila reveromycinica TaxID=659352 RepID=A0A7U3UQT4_9ACTN|nr:BTAD domain-containing putative transcriptional regulator [Streptomyces sp. SN-593]BBA97027.1 putative multi-domain regulatory protein [Streptomyces sp. SN-593]
MRYTILGPTQALRDDGDPVALAGGRLRALLTALALRPGRVVGADALIDEVWDGEPPAGAVGALQALVGRLRRVLGHEAVASVGGGYRLQAARDDVDLYRFERLAEEGARALADGDPVKAAGLLGDALALWRGPALADLPDRGTAAVRSEALRLDTRRQRLTAELALGRAGQVLPELAELAAAHPLDEPLRALHIRALRAAGRTAEALTAYEAVRRDLADRLGADPGDELRRLHAELLRPAQPAPSASPPASGTSSAAAPSGAGPAPVPEAAAVRGPAGPYPDRTAEVPQGWTYDRTRAGAAPAADPQHAAAGAGGLPPKAGLGNARARLTSFVGRERDLAAVRQDLAQGRLVTITGPGGTGKTRLSQEAGDLVSGRWADGVWYAELAPVSDPRTLPEAVISSLGLRETLLHHGSAAGAALAAEAGPRDAARQLIDYCTGRELLIVLDNCEHVVDAAATLAESLLASCPRLSVLATSREPLGVPGELVRPLDPLPDPTALRLLADRGAAARPGFSVEDDPVACAELCRRLDGLPLAIELAAARLRSLSPRQLADRLDDRFRLLTGGSRTLLPRQQTLRAVVDWSWDLLDPAERVLLRRLAVFRGGWTLDAVEAVCADPDPATSAAAGPAHPVTAHAGPAPSVTAHAAPAHPGPADREAAAAPDDRIAPPDAAALLASLVDKSLVLADQGDDGTRYRMLETISEYAGERLDASGERARIERHHVVYFREYVRAADPKLRERGQLVWFDRLEREHDNLRAALRRAVDGGDEQEALLLVIGCAWFWEVRNYVSERTHWPAAVAALGPDPFTEPPALVPVERGTLDDPPPLEGERLIEARRQVHVIEMSARDDEHDWWSDERTVRVGLALIDTYPPHLPQSARQPGIARAFGAFFSGDFDRVHELLDETVACCRRFGRTWELAYVLQLRAKVNNDISERLDASLADIGESRRLFEQIGDEWGTAETLSGEAEAAGNMGDWHRAVLCCREGIALARKVGAHQHVPVLAVRLGEALTSTGDPVEGERVMREGITDAERFGSASYGAAFYGRVQLAGLLSRTGRLPEALELIERTVEESKEHDSPVPGFVSGMLGGMKGYLLGRSGDPAGGLTRLAEGVGEMNGHPLARVIAPRVAIVMAPGVAELLVLLAEAEPGVKPERLERAAVLLSAHDRLRPVAVPPLEARDIERTRDRLRALLGEDGYAAAYAGGDGLGVGETVALMRDVD